MKNNKGFTLVEILAVIVLMGVMIGIAIPSISNINNKINKNLLENKKEIILVAAELYAKDKKITKTTTVTVDTLIQKGYVEADAAYVTPTVTNSCSYEYGCSTNPVTGGFLNSCTITLNVGTNVYATWGTCN